MARTNIGEMFHGGLVLVVGQGLEAHDHDGDVLGVPVELALLVISRSPWVSAASSYL